MSMLKQKVCKVNYNIAVRNRFNTLCIEQTEQSSRGLVVMHSTQANVVLVSRPIADNWWRKEGDSLLTARARTKVLSEALSKPQGIGGNRGKIESIEETEQYPNELENSKEQIDRKWKDFRDFLQTAANEVILMK